MISGYDWEIRADNATKEKVNRKLFNQNVGKSLQRAVLATLKYSVKEINIARIANAVQCHN